MCPTPSTADVACDKSCWCRREILSLGALAILPVWGAAAPVVHAAEAGLSKYEPMEALKDKDYGKSRMRYEDYMLTESGLQYKVVQCNQRAGGMLCAIPQCSTSVHTCLVVLCRQHVCCCFCRTCVKALVNNPRPGTQLPWIGAATPLGRLGQQCCEGFDAVMQCHSASLMLSCGVTVHVCEGIAI